MAEKRSDLDPEAQTTSDNDSAGKTTPDSNGELEDNHEYPSGIARALILGPVTLTYFIFFLDLAVVSTATPAITSAFGSLVDVGWWVYPALCYKHS